MVRLPVGVFELVRRRARDERGVGIVTALMMATIVFVIGATWTSVGTHQVEHSALTRSREQALHAAEAGIDFAMSRLAGDLHYAGTSSPVPLGDGTGEYEITVTPLDPNDPDDLDRYIVAKGYAPSKASMQRGARQIEQQVLLDPTDGFAYALFASPGGITGRNHANITGDVYSAADVFLDQNSNVFGDIVSGGVVTTSNNNLVSGMIHSLGDADLQNSQTNVQGSVYSGGNVAVGAQVDGDVQAAGSITIDSNASVGGTVAPNSPPPDPPSLTQPTFTWDPDNYDSSSTWTSASGFMTHWESNRDAFDGVHRVEGGDSSSNKITFDQKTTLTGDTTIVADGPITLSRDIANGTSGDVTLALVSNSSRDPAISFTNNVSLPSSIKILLFAPDGVIDFSQLKDFHGVVYGHEIRLSQNYTLDYDPPDVPGFDWDGSAAVHYFVQVRTFREVPFGS